MAKQKMKLNALKVNSFTTSTKIKMGALPPQTMICPTNNCTEWTYCIVVSTDNMNACPTGCQF